MNNFELGHKYIFRTTRIGACCSASNGLVSSFILTSFFCHPTEMSKCDERTERHGSSSPTAIPLTNYLCGTMGSSDEPLSLRAAMPVRGGRAPPKRRGGCSRKCLGTLAAVLFFGQGVWTLQILSRRADSASALLRQPLFSLNLRIFSANLGKKDIFSRR